MKFPICTKSAEVPKELEIEYEGLPKDDSRNFQATRFLHAYEDFISTRKRIKLLVQIANEYRKSLECIRLLEDGAKARRDDLIEEYNRRNLKDEQTLKKIEEMYQAELFLIRGSNKFALHTHIRNLRFPPEHLRALAQQFFDAAMQNAIITTDENHRISIQ